MIARRNIKRWLVLVGGGALGRWQAAACYALWKAGLLEGLAGIVGTSVGGLDACVISAGMVQGRGLDLLQQCWANIQADSDIYTPGVTQLLDHPFLNVLTLMGAARSFAWGPGALDRSPLEKLTLNALGDLTTDQVRAKTGIELLVRAYDYKAGQVRSLQGSLRDMALATSAIEGAFPSWQGFGDGGASDNAPIDVALARGANQIMVVYCAPDDPRAPDDPYIIGPVGAQTHGTGLNNVLRLMQNITKANEAIVAQQAQAAIAQGLQLVECYPPTDTGNFLDFRERGLWARGLAESAPAIAAAKALGW